MRTIHVWPRYIKDFLLTHFGCKSPPRNCPAQIWAALLTHLVLRWLKYKSGAACSYSRFAAIVRAIVWLKKDAMAILRSYGIAPPPDSGGIASGMPYLPGFEKMFLMSVG